MSGLSLSLSLSRSLTVICEPLRRLFENAPAGNTISDASSRTDLFHRKFSKMFGLRGSTGIVSDIVHRLRQTLSLHGVRVQYINIGGGVGGEIPDNKRLQYALQHIHGIGRAKAHNIVCELGVENKYVKDLSKRELYSLRELLSKYMLGNDLRKCVEKDIGRLVSIQCYRGFRHMDGLPCRGQRTHTNSRTRKSRPGFNASR